LNTQNRLKRQTTCPYCGVGCGVRVGRRGGQGQRARRPGASRQPRPPLFQGRGPGETLGLEGRLLQPEIGTVGGSWGRRWTTVAQRFSPHRRARSRGGGLLRLRPAADRGLLRRQQADEGLHRRGQHRHQFAAVHGLGGGRPQARLRHRHRALRLCRSGAGRPHRHHRLQPGLVPPGAVPAHLQGGARRRPACGGGHRSAPHRHRCDIADLHLALARDRRALFNGLLHHLRRGAGSTSRFRGPVHTRAWTRPWPRGARCGSDLGRCRARDCGLRTAEAWQRFFAWFARTERVVTLFSQGVNQSSAGTDKVNAIINCHLPPAASAARHGAVLPHRPAERDGRARGRRAGQHAGRAHGPRRSRPPRSVRDFWQAPRIATQPGLKAVDLFEAVEAGRIKALWIMATNPAVSLPEADRGAPRPGGLSVRGGLRLRRRHRYHAHAHVLLPAAAWGEKDGTVTNSERRISRQRAFLPAGGLARRTGGSSARSPGVWALAQAFPTRGRRRSSGSTRACRRAGPAAVAGAGTGSGG
jgi:assimilatory nitrate reductase catalytic subunit